MDPFTTFKFPAQPLQNLSPERVNGSTRPASTTTTPTKKTSLTISTEEDEFPNTSPTRKAKANLFADYSPQKPLPNSNVSGFTLPQSPSLPEIHALRAAHVRTNSDVQGLVKRFEHLDVRDKDAESAERRKRHEAELRRAQIAREEAESDVRRLREEVRRLKREGDEQGERARKVGRRLEVVMEESGAAKEAHAAQSSIYEKELRKARKEAFKSSSAVLKIQEELKSTRNTLRITQSGFELEKQKVQRKEQERFEMEYRLVPLQEELEQLKQRLRISEEERDALKTHLREEEVTRIAAEGMIALPVSQDMDLDLLSSPRKQRQTSPQRRTALEENKENIASPSKKALDSRHLAEELAREKTRREHAEELADFLRVECMFRCCGCQTASRLGHEVRLELDVELAKGVERVREGMEGILALSGDVDEMESIETGDWASQVKTEVVNPIMEIKMEETTDEQHSLPPAPDTVMAEDNDNIDRSTTFAAESPCQTQAPDDQRIGEEQEASENPPQPPTSPTEPTPVPEEPSTPLQPHPSIRTVTTTTTIPMHFTPSAKAVFPAVFDEEDAENIPPTPTSAALDASGQPTFDRAAALAAIEYRRGRAKSLANGQATPRKQMLEGVGVGGRRDISAPALGQKGGSRIGSVGRVGSAGTRSVRGTK